MKILIISQYFWPEQFRINDLALAMKERGHEVAVLTGMPNYPKGKMFSGYSWWKKRYDNLGGLVICRTPIFLRRQGRGWQLALNYLSFAFWSCLLGPWFFRKQRFDLIFVYEPSPFTVGFPGILMRRLKKAPMMFWVQDLWPESLSAAGAVSSEKVLRAAGLMVKWIYHRCDLVLVQSEAFIEPAVLAGADRQRTKYFPNWAESFYRPLARYEVDLTYVTLPEGFLVMFAGNLGEAQSLDTIIDAAHRLKEETDIKWIIVGDGRRASWMIRETERLGIADRFFFLGRHPAEVMPSFFSAADALLVTLKDDVVFTQTIPSKVQCYMACGRPVLAAIDGEGARVIKDAEAGIAVAAGDGIGLAEAVLKLFNMSAGERNVMGGRGLRYSETHFDRDLLIGKLEQWMKQLVEEQNNSSVSSPKSMTDS